MSNDRVYSTIGIPLIPRVSVTLPVGTTYATVLHAKLRGYGALVLRLPPAEAASLLGEFFGVLTTAVWEFGGQIFYVAEADMTAGFGVGDARHSQLEEALAAACSIQRRFVPIRQAWRRMHAVEAGIGIGLHRGEVAIGSFGPPGNASWTLVGDTANVAAALCRRARAGEVLLSAAAHLPPKHDSNAPEEVPCLRLSQLRIRGRSAPIDVWCVAVGGRLATRAMRRGRAVHH